jgi:hypothetical protein
MKHRNCTQKLKTATTSSGLSTGRVTGDGGNILNTSDFQSVSCQCPECTLCSGSWTTTLVSSSSSDLNVKSSNSKLLALLSNILGSKHRRVRGRLITVGLYLHSSSNTDKSLASRKIGNVYEGIIERCEDVAYCENLLSLSNLNSSDSTGINSWFWSVRREKCMLEQVESV